MGNYRINATTHSLIIQNVQPQDVLKQMNPKPFYCEAENVFGSVESGRARVSLDEMNSELWPTYTALSYVYLRSAFVCVYFFGFAQTKVPVNTN